jgi:hypothetical protein
MQVPEFVLQFTTDPSAGGGSTQILQIEHGWLVLLVLFFNSDPPIPVVTESRLDAKSAQAAVEALMIEGRKTMLRVEALDSPLPVLIAVQLVHSSKFEENVEQAIQYWRKRVENNTWPPEPDEEF